MRNRKVKFVCGSGVRFMLSEIERVAAELIEKHEIPVSRRFLLYIEVLGGENHVLQLGLKTNKSVEHFLTAIMQCKPLKQVVSDGAYDYVFFREDSAELDQFTDSVLEVLSKTLPNREVSSKKQHVRVIVNLGNLLAGMAIESAQKI